MGQMAISRIFFFDVSKKLFRERGCKLSNSEIELFNKGVKKIKGNWFYLEVKNFPAELQSLKNLLQENKTREALIRFEEALQQDPDEPSYRVSVANALLAAPQSPDVLDRAQQLLEEVLREHDKMVDAHLGMAQLYRLSRNPSKASDHVRKALILDPGSKQSRLIIAASETRLQQNLEHAAETLLDLAGGTLADEEPAFETVYYWLGECHLAKGDKASARQAFESALDFNPDHSEAKDGISRLK